MHGEYNCHCHCHCHLGGYFPDIILCLAAVWTYPESSRRHQPHIYSLQWLYLSQKKRIQRKGLDLPFPLVNHLDAGEKRAGEVGGRREVEKD